VIRVEELPIGRILIGVEEDRHPKAPKPELEQRLKAIEQKMSDKSRSRPLTAHLGFLAERARYRCFSAGIKHPRKYLQAGQRIVLPRSLSP
jgi:hypothetical protein